MIIIQHLIELRGIEMFYAEAADQQGEPASAVIHRARIEALTAAIAAMTGVDGVDAARYRFIRTLAAGRPEAFGPVEDAAFAANYGDPDQFDFNIDAAIDSARGR